jgi:hypothetical protein
MGRVTVNYFHDSTVRHRCSRSEILLGGGYELELLADGSRSGSGDGGRPRNRAMTSTRLP